MVNIKTALSLNYQQKLITKIKASLEENRSNMLVRGAKIGCFFGFSLFLIQATIGAALFVTDNILAYMQNTSAVNMMISLIVPTWCGWIAGNSFFFAAHAGAGKKSAKSIFLLL